MATITKLATTGHSYLSNFIKKIIDTNFTNLNTAVVSAADIVNDTTPQLGGDLDVNGSDIVSTSNANINLAPNGTGKVDVQGGFILSETTTSSGAGAVAVTGSIHEITTTGADALTLADGTEGQVLNVVMVSDGGDGTLTPTNFANGSTLTFDNNDTAQLLFTAGAWYFMGGNAAIA